MKILIDKQIFEESSTTSQDQTTETTDLYDLL